MNNIDVLIKRFEKQELKANEFNHLAHLKVAWYYICNNPIAIAKEKFHKGIIELTKELGAKDKYHRTLTDFFLDYLLQVKWFLTTKDWSEVEDKCPLLLTKAKTLLSYYYSKELLASEEARLQFLEPDLIPLERASLVLSDKEISTFELHEKDSPIIVSMPHHGQFIPHRILNDMGSAALDSFDTDWYLVQLYHFLEAMKVTRISANYSRYLIDLNRDCNGKALYPGSDNTELCPTSSFDYEPLYDAGREPDSLEINNRIASYWKPYHEQLQSLIAQAKEKFGFAILFEAHSIQSQVPRFFDGKLADFNFGTNDGLTVSREIKEKLESLDTGSYSKVVDGRFKGGYITRHYARPEDKVYTVQLELSQATYMNEEKKLFDPEKAQSVAKVIREIFTMLKEYAAK